MQRERLHLNDFDILDVFPLTAEPHLNPRPIDFSFDLVDALIFIQDFSRRQAI